MLEKMDIECLLMKAAFDSTLIAESYKESRTETGVPKISYSPPVHFKHTKSTID